MRKITTLLVVFLLALLSTNACAQEDKKKDNKVKIKLKLVNDDGEKVNIDTSFVLSEGQNAQDIIHKIMKEKGVDSKHDHSYFRKIDKSHKHNGNKYKKYLIEISEDEDGNKATIKKHKNMIFFSDDDMTETFDIDIDMDKELNFEFITDDGDSLKKIIKIGGKNIWHSDNDNVHIIRSGSHHFYSDNDETIDIMEDAKAGDTLKIKTIITLNGKETVTEKEIIVGDEHKKSKNIFIHKSDGDKKIKRKYIIKEEFDTDKKYKSKKIKKSDKHKKSISFFILKLERKDFKKLKLPKGYKKLDISDFDADYNGEKMTFNINMKGNSNIFAKMYDEKGIQIYSEELKKVSGKYSETIDIDLGVYIIEIKQGKKYFHRKIRIDE